MTVGAEDLIRQTFNMLSDEGKYPKEQFASRARLLALTLQQYEREHEDARIEVEALRQAIGDALGVMRKPRDRHARGAADPAAILEEALSGYAPAAKARIKLRHA